MLMKIPDDLSITLLSKEITSSKSAKNLGVTMDCNLTYDEHVTHLTSKCIGSLCQINRVKYLFKILSYSVNYCIVHQYELIPPRKTSSYYKKCKNFAARIVSGTRKFDHVTPILKQLHAVAANY